MVFSAVGVSGLLAITDPHLGTHRIARSSGIHSIPYTDADRHFVQVALAVSTAVAIVLTLIGIERLLRGRMVSGYLMLEYGLLVSIFLTEVFAFAHSQFAAALGLVVNLVLLAVVRVGAGARARRDGILRPVNEHELVERAQEGLNEAGVQDTVTAAGIFMPRGHFGGAFAGESGRRQRRRRPRRRDGELGRHRLRRDGRDEGGGRGVGAAGPHDRRSVSLEGLRVRHRARPRWPPSAPG